MMCAAGVPRPPASRLVCDALLVHRKVHAVRERAQPVAEKQQPARQQLS
jgi:hypothetical protein